MSREGIAYWTLIFAGSALAGWWLTIRPGATLRNLATPASFLVLTLAILLCLLAVSGTPANDFFGGMYHLLMNG